MLVKENLTSAVMRMQLGACRVEAINGEDPGLLTAKVSFDDLTPLHPQQRLDISGDAGIVGGGDTGAGAFTWGLGFIAMGIVGFIGPVALALLRGKKPA